MSSYPPSGLPHVGFASTLSESQAHENLAHFQACLSLRMRHVRTWLLAHDGPDPQAIHGAAYASALNAWAKAHWQQLPPAARLPTPPRWPLVPRDGPHIVYSLLSDLALTLGEAVRHANDDWHWGLNLDAIDLADGMATSRRVVLLADLQTPTPETREAVIDFESIVVHDYEYPESPNFTLLDTWARTAADAINGAYHRY